MKNYTHLAGRIFGKPWLMNPAKAQEIMGFLGPRLTGSAEMPERAAYGSGDPKDRKPYYVSGEGIAVISVYGTLLKRGSWMDSLSGLTSYEEICAELDDALEDTSVKAILLDVDSPGGECSGLFDLADHIYASRAIKPIWAIANDDAFSAAYAIASAAEKIYVTRTGGVGSIGVIALHCDQSAWDAKTGVKYTAIFAGARKNDGNPHVPLSDPARELIQAEVDRIYELFVSTAARNRNAKAANIRDTEAGLFFGDSGISMLADKLGTIDNAIEDLAAVIAAGSGTKQAKAQSALITQTTLATGSVANPAAVAANSTQQETEMKHLNVNAATADVEEEEKDDTMADKNCETDEKEVEQEEDDEEQEPKKTGKKAKAAAQPANLSASEMEQIERLCKLAGMEDKAADFVLEGRSVADVRKALLAARAKKQGEAVASHVPQGNKLSFASMEAQAAAIAAKNGISKEKAISSLLSQNPRAYEYYLQVEHPAQAAEILRRAKN